MTSGSFVVSLDFELLWGMRDIHTKASYGNNVLGVRAALPKMLDIFERRKIQATWATVGFVMCDGKDELLARAPSLRPTYADPKVSSYYYLDEAGPSERADPYYFAPSLAKLIRSCPGQEIGTHTFSHYYALEPGQTIAQFRADIESASKLFKDWGLSFESIVFARNQYDAQALEAARDAGLTHFRGNEDSWVYRASEGSEQTRLRRIARLVDAYVDLTGAHTRADASCAIVNVASSRFLRPVSRRLRTFEGQRLTRIRDAMTHAATSGGVYHLWWHPHNFGLNLDENCAFLSKVLDHFDTLKNEYGMQSRSMNGISRARTIHGRATIVDGRDLES